jgi:hypothetical protein
MRRRSGETFCTEAEEAVPALRRQTQRKAARQYPNLVDTCMGNPPHLHKIRLLQIKIRADFTATVNTFISIGLNYIKLYIKVWATNAAIEAGIRIC